MPVEMIGRIRAGLIVGLGLAIGSTVAAREPSAVIIELAEADGVPPPVCPGLAFHDRVVFLAADLLTAEPREGRAAVSAEPGLEHLEDTGFIVMLRRPRGCRLYLSRRKMATLAGRRDLPPGLTGITWRIDGDDRLQVDHGKDHRRLAPGEGWCLQPAAEPLQACPLRLHYYGRRPLYQGGPRPPVTAIDIGASVSVPFAGPGDKAFYRLTPSQAGMLVIEYHSKAGPGSLDIAIRGPDERLLGTGGAAIPGPGDVDVALGYRGSGPAPVDVGFLFTPDTPLACKLSLVRLREDPGVIIAHLRLENRGSEPVSVTRPGPGTVRWYVGETLVAAARPGRLPEDRLLAPGAALTYDVGLALPEGFGLFSAEVSTGAAGTLVCGPAAPAPENNSD